MVQPDEASVVINISVPKIAQHKTAIEADPWFDAWSIFRLRDTTRRVLRLLSRCWNLRQQVRCLCVGGGAAPAEHTGGVPRHHVAERRIDGRGAMPPSRARSTRRGGGCARSLPPSICGAAGKSGLRNFPLRCSTRGLASPIVSLPERFGLWKQ